MIFPNSYNALILSTAPSFSTSPATTVNADGSVTGTWGLSNPCGAGTVTVKAEEVTTSRQARQYTQEVSGTDTHVIPSSTFTACKEYMISVHFLDDSVTPSIELEEETGPITPNQPGIVCICIVCRVLLLSQTSFQWIN